MRLSRSVAYSLPMVPAAMLHTPALSMLPALYAKHSDIDLVLIGILLAVTRILDAVTDPLIGMLSDRTRTRLGARKPWLIAGMVLCCVGAWFWFRPGPDTDWVYFLFWSTVVYLGWTLFEIPHSAWLSELTHDYARRASLASFRTVANFVGWAVFLALPLLPVFQSSEMTPRVTALASWIIVLVFPAAVLVAVMVLPSGTAEVTRQQRFSVTLAAAARNRPFQYLAGFMLFSSAASGMVAGMYFFYLDAYLGILDRIAHIGLAAATVSIFAAALWGPLIARIEKHRTMSLATVGNILVLAGMGLTRPGGSAFAIVLLLFCASAMLNAGAMVSQYAIIADVADYDRLKTGHNNAGSYYALSAFLLKLGLALGGGLGFAISGLFGFRPAAENDELAIVGFFLSFIFIPMLLNCAAAALVWAFPLDQRRHAVVQKWLTRRRPP